jgi:hypothetical protein
LGDKLSKISSAITGDETWTVTKAADGTTTATKAPITNKERWGQIAAVAIGGALKGLAAGQGPGGAAKALGAGGEFGMQVPQQQQKNAQEQADQGNKQLMFSANKALLQQKIAMNVFALNQMDANLTKEQVDRANENEAWLLSNPNNQKVADFKTEADAMQYEKTHPELLKLHTGSGYHTEMTQGADGKPQISLYTVDQGWLDRKNDQDVTYKRLEPGDTLDAPMKLVPHTVKAGSDTNRNISIAQEAETKRIGDYQIAIGKLKDTQTKTASETALHKDEGAKARAETAESYAKTKQIQQQMDVGPGGPNAGLGQDIYRGRADISQLRTRKDWPIIYAAARQYGIDNGLPPLNIEKATAKFNAYKKTQDAYTGNGEAATKIQGFSTLLGHLGDVVDNANELQRTNSPWLNRPINELDKEVAGGTQVGPAEIRTLAPAKEFGNVLANNRALNNDEKEDAKKSLNVNLTPAQQRLNAKQMAHTAIDRLAPVFQAYREASDGDESPTQLTPRAIQTLKSVGLYDYAMQQLHPQGVTPQQGGGGGGGAQLPAALPNVDVRTDNKGNYTQLQNGKWVAVAAPNAQ